MKVSVPECEISRFISVKPFERCLHEDVEFIVEDDRITVFKGFWWDGASIPMRLWGVVGSPFTGKYVIPTILHDLLYIMQIYERKKTDDVFYYMNEASGLPYIKNMAIYTGVRAGGWISYNSSTEEMKKGVSKHFKIEKV